MRKIYTLVLLLLTAITIHAQGDTIITQFPYYESFEDTTGKISVSVYDMDSASVRTKWTHYYNTPELRAHTGKGYVASQSTYQLKDDTNIYQVDSVDNWLVLPLCSLPNNVIGINFSFYVAPIDSHFVEEHYEVYVSAEGGTPDMFSEDAIFHETLTEAGWQARVLDLTNYAGESIWIAIRHVQSYGRSGIALDDILLEVAEPCQTITTFPYVEDFESDVSCWSVFSEVDTSAIEGAGWQIYQGYGHDSSAAAISFSVQTLNTDHWLISPALFLLPNADRIVLSWWVRNGNNDMPEEHYKVYVGEHTSHTLLRKDSIVYSATLDDKYGKWQHVQVNISAFSGKIVHIGFRHCATDSQVALRIDDVRVDVYGGDPIITPGIDDSPAPQELTIYPNPTHNIVAIEGCTILRATLYNAIGHKVLTTTGNTLNLESLHTGVYTLHATTPQGNVVRRIVKK